MLTILGRFVLMMEGLPGHRQTGGPVPVMYRNVLPFGRGRRVSLPTSHGAKVPPRWLEWAYYASMFYAIFGVAWGLSFPLAGAAILMLLAAYCVSRQGANLFTPHSPIALPLYCAMSFLAIQVVVHGEPVMQNRDFVIWILTLIVLQSLSLRPGFFHRFALAMVVIGVTALPYLRLQELGVERVSVEQAVGGNLANPNGLAEWFGFCAIYLVILGIETKRFAVRMISWMAAVGCLYIVGLTVSRGALLGVAAAIAVAFRRSLRRAFWPAMCLIILGWVAFELGLFAKSVALYESRGMEESGRLLVWPLVWARFMSSPLIGVGAANVYTSTGVREISPHNGFLFIALASGIVPLAFYIVYWWRAALGAIRLHSETTAIAPFRTPLLVFAFLCCFASNTTFMASWVIVALSTTILPDRHLWRRGPAMRRFTKFNRSPITEALTSEPSP